MQKLVQQWRTNVMSFCMQFEKRGCQLLWEAFRSEGQLAFLLKARGEKGEYQSWKTEVNIGVLPVNKANSPSLWKASRSNRHTLFLNCMRNDVWSVHRCWTSFLK